ncbi:MAG: peptidoglycan-binding domain-containing protein [Paracoccaceae bacterium]
MKAKWIASPCVAAALALTPATRVAADAGDAIAGAIIGGIIGSAITKNEMKKKQQQQRSYSRPSTKSSSSGVSSLQREQNREVQIALNHFGYAVGTPDGVLGARSRSAVSQYQALLGYPPTGQLTEYERTLLTSAYHRAIAGGPQVAQITQTSPQGIRGLLLDQRDLMAGVPSSAPAAPAAAAAIGTMAAVAPQTAPATEAPAMPQFGATTAGQPGLPSFLGSGVAQVSLASHCNKISLQTNTNGGYITVANMNDPAQALGEQFCIARTYAMSSGEDLASKIPGFTPQQIAEQCKSFGPVLKEQVAALSVKPRDEVLEGVTGFVMSSGMAPAQLAGTAKICLGVGYTTDAMDVAIGSALILTALGDRGYAELVGHHLGQGFGTAPRADLAKDWYQMGLDAAEAGQAVFAPGLPERTEVIRKAVFATASKAEAEPAATLPVFATVPGGTVVSAPAVQSDDTIREAESALPVSPGAAMSAAARLPLLLLGN